jgi:hypothetical protein
MLYSLHTLGGVFALRSVPQKKEQEGMGAEDNGPNLEELGQRMEKLEQENRELREELGSGASEREFGTPQQQPQATQAKEMPDASSKRVSGLLLGPRNKQDYSRPLVGILPPYLLGVVLTCAVAGYGGFYALWGGAPPMRWLGLIAALFFGVYAGIRDGREFVFGRFQYVGLITAIGVTVVAFLASFWAVSNWTEGTYTGPTPMAWLLRHLIFVMVAVFASTWLLFISGASLGTALQLFWTGEQEQVGQDGSIQSSSEGGSASTSGVRTRQGGSEGGSASASGVKAQVWLGFAGTVLAALIGLIGTLIGP